MQDLTKPAPLVLCLGLFPPPHSHCHMHRLPLSRRECFNWPVTRQLASSQATQDIVNRGVLLPVPPLPSGGTQAGSASLPRSRTAAALQASVTRAGAPAVPSPPPPTSSGTSGAHPRRRDLPVRSLGKRKRQLSSSGLPLALRSLDRDKHAASSRKSMGARLTWWKRQRAAHGGQPWPITRDSLRAAAAILKAGQYRSAAQYFYTLKRQHVVLGHRWGQDLALELADCKRSCARGLGPSKQAQPIPLDRLPPSGLPSPAALTCGTDAVLVGCWWLMREIELAALQKGDITFAAARGCGTSTINLAVSKADPSAKGVHRTLGCACPSPLCPVAAARRLVQSGVALANSDYLVRNLAGLPATKVEVVREIRSLGGVCGGASGLTGHSLRVTGAQRLALAGVTEGRISMFGRWASKAMLLYVREALLGVAGGGLAEQVEQATLTPTEVAKRVRLTSPTADPLAIKDFTCSLGKDVVTPLSLEEVDARWERFRSSLAEDVEAARARALPTICQSAGGRTHRIVSHAYTACGWRWAAGCAEVVANVPITCRKCSGESIRWARVSSA